MILNTVWLKIVSVNMHSNPRPASRGAFLCFLHIKSHHENVVAHFKITVNFARLRTDAFFMPF